MIRPGVGGWPGVDAAFVLAVVAILAFAFTNGFHDAANAIATLVATRGARPGAVGEVTGRRELYRRVSRISETLIEAADLVWYATVKEG